MLSLAAVVFLAAVPMEPRGFAISTPVGPSPLVRLAAREVRRYLYLRTGERVPIREARRRPAAGIAVGVFPGVVASPPAGGYLLETRGKLLQVRGSDDVQTLYAAYAFAESLGVRFYLHGDTVPDGRIPLRLPMLHVRAKPLFRLRGIQPFHDFPEGPDWWNAEDYKAIVDQLPKLRMNFLGLHTYPEGIAEPTVWIGQPSDVGSSGRPEFAYPSSYQNTLRGDWGYSAKRTSEFHFGAAELFPRDDFGPEAMAGLAPKPRTEEQCRELFTRVGHLLKIAFSEAHALGVKTCVGTETPLTVPKSVQARYGRPIDAAARQTFYEGIFRRIQQTHQLDYYWMWTNEGWTWAPNSNAEAAGVLEDLDAARRAAKAVGAPFALATCGWVLGPQQDRASFDKRLPKSIAMSCINRQVGMEPVEPDFASIKGREKWAIPWLEDDPALTAPQLWAGRMRRDARDALRYGCTGLMGIHWRTRNLAPNVLALSRAAWDQRGWPAVPVRAWEAVGGNLASYGEPISGTREPAVYQTVRWSVTGYRIRVPKGICRVTLKFSELAYNKPGVRVFDVLLNGRTAISGLDIFARAGKDRAWDFVADRVPVPNGLLVVGFTPRVEFPCIAGIVVQAKGKTIKINCGGPAVDGYEADQADSAASQRADDLYLDWATAEFGEAAARPIARIFAAIDGKLPRPLSWTDGPGGITPDDRPWGTVSRDYAFVSTLEALRPRVRGVGNLDRYDYWLNGMRYLRAVAQLRCVWAASNRADREAQRNAEHAASLRREKAGLAQVVYRCLLATVSTTGELGTLANWEQHNLPALFGRTSGPLPSEYTGPLRIVMTTVRTRVDPGRLALRVRCLSASPVRGFDVLWRPLGRGAFSIVALRQIARGVYEAELPATDDLEYYVAATNQRGETAHWPASAPKLNQSVVVSPLAN